MMLLRRLASPRGVALLAGVMLGFVIALLVVTLVAVGNGQQIVAVERRAAEVGEAAAKDEVKEQVAGDIKSEVTDQLDERLVVPSTITVPDNLLPDELLPAQQTTTTEPGPFDLTTTTTVTEPPPTTTTIIEVPTTVTIPEVPLP